MRERKEKEKQREQDREISKTQWCAGAMKAEMEVKEGLFWRDTQNQPSRAGSGLLGCTSLGPRVMPRHEPGGAVSLLTAA